MTDWLSHGSSPSSKRPRWGPFTAVPATKKAWIGVTFACLAVGVLAAFPSAVWGVDTIIIGGPGSGPDRPVKPWLVFLIDALTGTTAQYVAGVGMIVILYGIVVRAQRGEPIQSLATIGASFIILVNVKDLLKFTGYYYASLASSHEAHETIINLII